MTDPPVTLDPALDAALSSMPDRPPLGVTIDRISAVRSAPRPTEAELRSLLAEKELAVNEVTATGYEGSQLRLVVVTRAESATTPRPCFYHVHGGGMVFGGPLDGALTAADWVVEHDAVLVSPDYRLAPEHPDPYPVEDCYAGLVWSAAHAEELAIDPRRILLVGASAGGGLAAGTALLARDRRGPRAIGQLLMCPMLDDRDATLSTRQVDGMGVWDRTSNRTGWDALLGGRRGGADVSHYAAPARASDLAGLPAAYVDCGSAEVFRDEDVAYASALWAAGVPTELHVWAGGFHGFEGLVPEAAISRASTAARATWVARMLRGG